MPFQETLSAQDIPKLWRAKTTTDSQRKQLLRLLIEDVTIRVIDEPWSLEVIIRWKTGLVTRHTAKRVVRSPHTTPPEIVARIAKLYRDHSDPEIARILDSEGLRTGSGREFTTLGVRHIRQRRDLWKKM